MKFLHSKWLLAVFSLLLTCFAAAQDYYSQWTVDSFNIYAGPQYDDVIYPIDTYTSVKYVGFIPYYSDATIGSPTDCVRSLNKTATPYAYQIYFACKSPDTTKKIMAAQVYLTYTLKYYPSDFPKNIDLHKGESLNDSFMLRFGRGNNGLANPEPSNFWTNPQIGGYAVYKTELNSYNIFLASTGGNFIYKNSDIVPSGQINQPYNQGATNEFHIDHDTQKGGSKFEIESALFIPILPNGLAASGMAALDSSKPNELTAIPRLTICEKSKSSNSWISCKVDNINFIAAQVFLYFKDDKGNPQYCEFIYYNRNGKKYGTICLNNSKFGLYNNGSHDNTINIGKTIAPSDSKPL